MLAVHRCSDVDNAALCRLLDAERLTHRSLYQGDGVWAGPKTLFGNSATDRLQEFIRSCLPAGAWQLQGWGVVLDAGGRIEWHDHTFPGNVWSGVYYPASGGGGLCFDDWDYEPEESTLIVFPADMPHSVAATARRYSIAFNARNV